MTGETGRRGSEVLVRRQQGASEGPTVSRSDVAELISESGAPGEGGGQGGLGERRAIRVLS